jgi:threonine dehydratase
MKTPQKPIPQIQKDLNLKHEVWFKFENKHHFGSHKGRSIPVMIDEYAKLGKTSFSISSSGNAALAALRYIASHNKNKPGQNLKLVIFVGQSIEKSKFEKLKSELVENIELKQVENPKQDCLKYSEKNNAIYLRASTDPLALNGYESLAEELSKIPDLAAVFVASSSGTSAEGIFKHFQKFGLNPEIHIVQTEFCHPLSNYYYENKHLPQVPSSGKRSIADAIVDKVGRRKESISDLINFSGGFAWIVSEPEIENALAVCNEINGEHITANGALPIAGLKKAVSNGYNWQGPIVCIIGGD